MKDAIIDHEERVGWPEVPGSQGFVEFVRMHWNRVHPLEPLPEVNSATGSVSAYVNHGRWVVECPGTNCAAALVASLRSPYFICHECGSPENGGAWYNVTFPANRQAIEALLVLRPATHPLLAQHRNWLPGESVEDLRQQNREHGVRDR